MLATSPHRADQDARALRERLELVVLSDDDAAIAGAARALVQFCDEHPEYRLCSLVPETAPRAPETAKRIPSKYDGRCGGCDARIAAGDFVFWTPGQKGVRCNKCGGAQ